jgi:hypothetical protein
MTGCISQCFKYCPGYVANHASELFKTLVALVKRWDEEVNRNISYCLAEMFEKSTQAMLPHLQEGLLTLKQIFEHNSSDQPCKDNAVAAICRIIYTVNPPMPHQVFLDNLVNMMPFKGDEEEEASAWKCIIFLFSVNPQLILPYREGLVKLLENDFSNPKKYGLSEQLMANLREFSGKLFS